MLSEKYSGFYGKKVKMKLSKCSFGVSKVKVLGYEIVIDHILPKYSHRLAMEIYRVPTNGRELLSFLGGAQFFTRHIKCAADHMAPL